MNDFVHLTVKSKASILNGLCDIDAIVNKAIEFKQKAVALTDNCNVFNAIPFYKECLSKNIKPILGVTVLFCEDVKEAIEQKIRHTTHLTLLAENNEGWKNITRIISESYDENHFFYVPRVDLKLLEKYKNGVIVLSGNCIDGAISYYLYDKQDGDSAALFKAEALTRAFINLFGQQNFYLEIQNVGFHANEIINTRIRNIGKKYGIGCVSTCNVHYISPLDAEAHNVLLSVDSNKYNKITRVDFNTNTFYFKTRDEIGLESEELDLTNRIADRCNVTIDLKKRRLPTYKFIPDGYSSKAYLYELVNKGLNNLQFANNKEYVDRINRELADICEMGFVDYFLIVHDVISWAKNQNMLMGRGRGSVGGSLVAYCLGITEIDPIKYNLIWERFLNKGRGGLPDVDSDFPRTRRQEVLEYIRQRFGTNNVAQLVTLGGLQARAVLKEVFRVYNMPFEEANKITALVPKKDEDHSEITIDEAIKMVPELREYEQKYKSWFSIAKSLEGCFKSTGIHPAGVVISDVPFDESEYPLARSKEGDLIFGYEMNTVDSLSLLKLDILGVAALDCVQTTFDLVKERKGIDINRNNIPLDDKKTFELMSQGLTCGVFQLESQLGKTWSKKIQPTSLQEIADIISLIRPACLDNGLTEQYANTKNHEEDFLPAHPLLADITKDTYGVLLFQEQTILACQKLANFSLQDADYIRMVIGKKKIDQLKKWKPKFIESCVKNGVVEEDANVVWEQLEKFAGYQFNKSHAIGYGLLSYETAYLKANYPIEFFCAKLKQADGDLEKINILVYDAKLFNIDIIAPSVKGCNKDFSILNDKQIAFGLSALKGVGNNVINDIIILSKDINDFTSFLVKFFSTKNKISSAVMNALIKSGAFDCFGSPRIRMLAQYKLLEGLTEIELSNIFLLKEKGINITESLSDISDESKFAEIKEKYKIKVPNVKRRSNIRDSLKEYRGTDLFDSKAQNIAWEKHFLGIPLSGSESDIFKAKTKCVDIIMNSFTDMGIELSVCIDAKREHICKNGKKMAFVTGRDDTYILDNIVVFPDLYEKKGNLIEEGNILKIKGKISETGSVIVNIIERLK